MFLQLNIQMMPMASRDCFAIEITTDANSGINTTRAVADSIEQVLRKDPRITSVTSFIGESAPRFAATYSPKVPASNFAQLIVNTESEAATETVLAEHEKWLHSVFPEAAIRLKQMDYQAVNAQVEIRLSGADRDVLYPIADTIKAQLHSMDDILQWVHCDNDRLVSSVNVNLDNDNASRLGINRSLVSLSLMGSLDGSPISSIRENGREIPVVLYSSGKCDRFDELANSMVPSLAPGMSVPLRQVAGLQPDWHPEYLLRYAGEPEVVVSADLRYAKSYAESSRRIS